MANQAESLLKFVSEPYSGEYPEDIGSKRFTY